MLLVLRSLYLIKTPCNYTGRRILRLILQGQGGVLGGRDRTLAVKRRKKAGNQFFLVKKSLLKVLQGLWVAQVAVKSFKKARIIFL